MSISKNNLRAFDSSVPSGARSTNSKITNWVGAACLAGLILLAGNAKAVFTPYNVLVNPGAEAGNVTGWNLSPDGYIYVVNTNQPMAGVTNGTISTNQILATSGAYAFQTFDITADSAYMYQDYAAMPGSQWSASVWAICYASNYFDSAFAYMSVAFYDTNGNVVLNDPNNPNPNVPGVYAGVVLDPMAGDAFPPYIIAPPQAHDTNGWVYIEATNFWYSYAPANTKGTPGANIEGSSVPINVASTMTAPPGTAFVRYQLEYDNMATDGGAVYWDDCVLQKLNQTDPDITNPQPASVTCSVGDPASFTVNALSDLRLNSVGSLKAEKIFYQWQKNGTNLPVAGGNISGFSTNAALSLTNCQSANAGMYACWICDSPVGNGLPTGGVTNYIRSVPVTLTVTMPTCPPPNRLGNPGFENAPAWTPWQPFNGAYFEFDENWCAMVGDNGDRDNGFYQVVAGVTPGTYWKAGGWAYISSANPFTDANTCRIQIWFKDSGGITVGGTPTYESFKLYGLAYTNADMQYTNIDTSSPDYGKVMYHTFLPNDTWCFLPITNIVNNAGIGLQDDLPINTWPDGVFRVPTNANVAQINFQVYEYCPQSSDTGRAGGYNGNGTDAVYWDDMQLIQVSPPSYFTAAVDGTNIDLSFGAGAGLVYSVQYKTNLWTSPIRPKPDADWSLLTMTNAPMSWQTNAFRDSCDYYPITVSVPIKATPMTTGFTSEHRFYRVKVQ